MITVQAQAIDGWTTHSEWANWDDAVDQAELVHGRIVCEQPQEQLEFLEWHDPQQTGTDGYDCWDYFDGDVYLGADSHGVEPVFLFRGK